jgi:lipopolysaccharide export system protein LptA
MKHVVSAEWSKTTLFLGVAFLFISFQTQAQTVDTANKLNIEILPGSGTNLQFLQTDSGGINKLIHNVQLKQDDTYMYCDSAYINLAKNNMEAFGNVRIVQTGGTEVQSNYLRYTGNTKKAYLQGNVSLTDGKNNLWSEDLYYDVGTKIGTYTNGGTLQSDVTTLSSNSGMYNARTKDSRFTGDVYVTNPKYTVTSKDLAYNTATEVVSFLDSSVVVNDSTVLQTYNGTWDAKNKIAHFITRSSLQDRAQYIEADKMNYDRNTGFGTAMGHVICIDTAMKATLYCQYAQYNELTKKLYAVQNPVMKKMNGNDSLFIRADTFFSAPIATKSQLAKDSISQKKQIGKHAKETVKTADTTTTDTTSKRYFIGYHHVLIFSDSLQAKCDSISYSQADSTMRLLYQPVAWSRNAQITGDTILLYIADNKLSKLFVPNNALVVSQSGPEKAQLFDQVQGNMLWGYFQNNNIKELIVYPNAESIYFSKDDAGAYLGVDVSQSERMKVIFADKEIDKIIQYHDVHHKMIPMKEALNNSYRLSRFQWLINERPKSIKELFEYKATTTQAKKATAENTSATTNTTPTVENKKLPRRGMDRKRKFLK